MSTDSLTGDKYVNILSDHLHPFMSVVPVDRLRQFQRDNVTFHTSRVAMACLQEHSFPLAT